MLSVIPSASAGPHVRSWITVLNLCKQSPVREVPRRLRGSGGRQCVRKTCAPHRLFLQCWPPLCARANLQLSFVMANETAIVDAEDLKKRAETLRRFL